MRFSDNRFYIEKYVKCANCGMLIYDKGIEKELFGKTHLYCSQWCVEWARLRATHDGYFRLPIVQPKLPIEAGMAAEATTRLPARHGDDEDPRIPPWSRFAARWASC